MKPEKVNPSNFKVVNVIFDNDHFSIAYGVWENGNKTLAMRWNGEGDKPGYPKTFGYPVWFIVDEELHIPIVQCLVSVKNAKKDQLLEVIKEII